MRILTPTLMARLELVDAPFARRLLRAVIIMWHFLPPEGT